MLGSKITVLYGENSFERSRKLAQIKAQAQKSGFEIEKIDAEGLIPSDFITQISGVSLFADKRLVIFRNLSENKSIWENLETLVGRISSDVHLCLIEDKIDKRSSLYKNLSKTADFQEFKKLEAKGAGDLAELARQIAKARGLSMSLMDAKFLISWVGVDEWAVKNAVEKLALLGVSDKNSIKTYMSQNIEANTFGIFEMALDSNIAGVLNELAKMKNLQSDDAGYQFLGLLITQFFNLSALRIGKEQGLPTAQIAKDLGINAWALGKMEPFAARFNRENLAQMAEIFAAADQKSKTSSLKIWDLVEAVLLEIAEMFKR